MFYTEDIDYRRFINFKQEKFVFTKKVIQSIYNKSIVVSYSAIHDFVKSSEIFSPSLDVKYFFN